MMKIKYLCKVATAGSAEARKLEKAKKVFEEIYREGEAKINTADEGGVRYSFGITQSDINNYVDAAYKKKIPKITLNMLMFQTNKFLQYQMKLI